MPSTPLYFEAKSECTQNIKAVSQSLKFNLGRGQILIEMTTLGSDSSGHKLESNLSPVYRGVRFLHTLNWSLGSFLRVRGGTFFYKWHLLKRDWPLHDHSNNMPLIPRTFLKSPNQRKSYGTLASNHSTSEQFVC